MRCPLKTEPRQLGPPVLTALTITFAVLILSCGSPKLPTPMSSIDRTEETSATHVIETAGTLGASSSMSTVTPTVTTTLDAGATPQKFENSYDSSKNMRRLWSLQESDPKTVLAALRDAHENKDRSQVPVILDLMRLIRDQSFLQAATFTLSEITGEDFTEDPEGIKSWTEFVGNHLAEYQPPAGYIRWKANLLGVIDTRIKNFVLSATIAQRIDLTEVVWGGIRTDGIPDLQNAPTLEASKADYLNPDDRVFGVSINGEYRAYPLRIMNVHEMANDTLGGEPITLAY